MQIEQFVLTKLLCLSVGDSLPHRAGAFQHSQASKTQKLRIQLEEHKVCAQGRGRRLDQIRVGFRDGIDLFGVGNLFSLEHATTRLIDHPLSHFTVVVERPG